MRDTGPVGPVAPGGAPPVNVTTALAMISATHILQALGLLGAIGGLHRLDRLDVDGLLAFLDVVGRHCGSR